MYKFQLDTNQPQGNYRKSTTAVKLKVQRNWKTQEHKSLCGISLESVMEKGLGECGG